MIRKFVMEVILLPHVAMVVSKQHHYVTETLPILAPGQGTHGADDDETSDDRFCSGVATAKCVLVTVAVTITPRGKRISRDRPDRDFYKLRPANKTDHLCQSWQ